MSYIESCAVNVPQYHYSLDELQSAGRTWLAGQSDRFELFSRLMASSNIGRRGFVAPLDKILQLGGLHERSLMFEELAPALALPSIERALQQAGKDPGQIDRFIFTSCSVPAIPSVDGILVRQAGLSTHVRRLPIFQHGCAGGIVGLELAADFAALGQTVLLTSVELCSLVFQSADARTGQLVGGALFSDGAASVVVSPASTSESKFEILASSSCLIPGTRHLMGYELLDDGLHLLLDRELPFSLAQHFPGLVATFLKTKGLEASDVAWWLFHPGGPKVLTGLQRALNLADEQCRFAGEVLSAHGNMSSATILFVLNQFLTQKAGRPRDLALLCGVGPGLTVELILCRIS